MADERKPWDQLEGESNEAYARFLAYRNLGPARSIEFAYAQITASNRAKTRTNPKRASGQWSKDSEKFNWLERASAWDIDMLEQHGRNAVVAFVTALDTVSIKILNELANPKRKPANWQQIVQALNVLGSFIPSETVEAIRDNAREHRTPAVGASSNSVDGGTALSK